MMCCQGMMRVMEQVAKVPNNIYMEGFYTTTTSDENNILQQDKREEKQRKVFRPLTIEAIKGSGIHKKIWEMHSPNNGDNSGS